MPPIVTTIEVDRSASDVFAYATDPARFSEWQQGVTGGHMEDSTLAVGTRCHTTRRIGGANRPSVSEVTHIDPPRTWRNGNRRTDPRHRRPHRATADR